MGFWTDITRTYTLQLRRKSRRKCKPRFWQHAMLRSMRSRRIRVRQKWIAAAREVIEDFGLGQYLKHGTGHGVGFSPMSAYSIPRVHAGSPDVLREGMVFNVEPAVYIEGYGGVRHCDMVVVTRSGYELLTDFQSDIESLTTSNRGSLANELGDQVQSSRDAITAEG